MSDTPADLITLSEAAELLGYSGVKAVSGVSKLLERGQLTAYPYAGPVRRGWHSGRRMVSRAAVEALREQRRNRARRRLDLARQTLAKLA